MKIELKNKKTVSILLLSFAAILMLLLLVKAARAFTACLSAKNAVEIATENSAPDPNAVKKYFAGPKGIAEQLKKKNMFFPPEPNHEPIKEVMGILGNEVLIQGQWYKVGDKVGEAEILAIEATQIRYRWEGKELTAAPIEASGIRRQERADRNERPEGTRPAARARPGGEGGPGRGRRAFFRNLSDEERQEMRQMRERFRNASEEEREQMRAEMRERFGDRRRPNR